MNGPDESRLDGTRPSRLCGSARRSSVDGSWEYMRLISFLLVAAASGLAQVTQ